MNNPEFSIIIPVFNRAEKIHSAVRSVINQTFNNWELIIVDDGSTDNLKGSVANYLSMDNIRYLYQENSGVSVARNMGIRESTGDYIIFLDSDDFFSNDLLKNLMSINYQDYDLIFWYTKKIIGAKIEIWKPRKLEKIYNGICGSFLAGSVCYRKALLQNVRGFDENLKFGENYELGMRLSHVKELSTMIIPKVLLNYNINRNFRPHSEPDRKLKSLNYLLEKHIDMYRTDKFSYSRLLYQVGFLNEKLGRKSKAFEKYKQASDVQPFYLKPIIKRFLYKFDLG